MAKSSLKSVSVDPNPQAQDTRRAILECARQIFSQKGYRETTMEDIASGVGIKAPSLYHHFRSKKDILFGYLEAHLLDFVTAMDEVVHRAPAEPSEQLRALIRAYVLQQLRIADRVPFLNLNVYVTAKDVEVLSARQRATLAHHQNRFIGMLKSVLEAGRRSGVLNYKDVTLTAFALIGLADHVVYWCRPDGRLTADEVADRMAELALATAGHR